MPFERFTKVLPVVLVFAASLAGCTGQSAAPARRAADKPAIVDPINQGAADATLVYNRQTKTWFCFWTSRRALDTSPGFIWVHDTRIGCSESADGGNTWTYRRHLELDLAEGAPQTHWAPEIVYHDGVYHMYLTHVKGVFADWGAKSDIVHLTSSDLITWKKEAALTLDFDASIDADVLRLPDGTWRMWYKGRNAGIYYADSPDLYRWTPKGSVVLKPASEAPVAFRWQGKYWLIRDEWSGLAVHHSQDAVNWVRQEGPNLFAGGGEHPLDRTNGGHADVVVSGERAFIFYFVHPHRAEGPGAFEDPKTRPSVIHVAELKLADGRLVSDRNAPVFVDLRAGD